MKLSLAGVPVLARLPEDAVPGELLVGTLGSLVGLAGGYFGGRVLATALGVEAQPAPKDLVTVGSGALGITAGASLGVISLASSLGVEGNALGSVGGALLGMLVGMATEPLLALLLSNTSGGSELFRLASPVVEALGFLSIVVLPAVGATAGFNMGVRYALRGRELDGARPRRRRVARVGLRVAALPGERQGPALGPRLHSEVRKEVRHSGSRTQSDSTCSMWAPRERGVRFSWVRVSAFSVRTDSSW